MDFLSFDFNDKMQLKMVYSTIRTFLLVKSEGGVYKRPSES